MSADLSKSLGIYRGTALLLSIVIGAGLLTLPGLAVERVGDEALLAWILCACAAFPLLAVFIVLGQRYPDAGGIASYAKRAFGPLGGRTASLLFLGAVIFGLPSIALSGGHYLATSFGGSPHFFAFCLLLGAILPHVLPGEGAAALMAWIASMVLGAIVIFLAIGLFSLQPDALRPVSLFANVGTAFIPFTMLFFAFTGWEVGAGVAEEFRDAKHDFPRAMIFSFCIATGLYLVVAYVTMQTNLNGRYEAPFVEMVRPLLGDFGAASVGVAASLIVFANLSGAIWGVSRLVYGLARDGDIFSRLAATHHGRPLPAVAATIVVLFVVLLLSSFGIFDLAGMLALAGQNFLILYGLSAAVLFTLARSWRDRALAVLVLSIVGVLVALQGMALAYPLTLFGIAIVVEVARRRRLATAS